MLFTFVFYDETCFWGQLNLTRCGFGLIFRLISLSISNVSSQAESVMSIKDSVDVQINNSTISEVSQLAVELINSKISKAYNFSMAT